MQHAMNLTSLTSWKVKERAIHQPMQHAMNLTSLTFWKVKGEGNLSAHTACNVSDITYLLEGEGGGQFVSPHSMQ